MDTKYWIKKTAKHKSKANQWSTTDTTTLSTTTRNFVPVWNELPVKRTDTQYFETLIYEYW